jgi:hypothetical protein
MECFNTRDEKYPFMTPIMVRWSGERELARFGVGVVVSFLFFGG